MQVSTPSERPTLASTARRAQIVAATIEVIAEHGLAQASFARIAERAGLSSTRLISYHFAGKEELIGAVVQDVLGRLGQYVGDRIDAAEKATEPGNATAILRAYIEGNIAFIAAHQPHMQALVQIVLSAGGLPPDHGAQPPPDLPAQTPLEGLLKHGQATGEFRSFDVGMVGSAIQRAIEGLPFMLVTQPELDCQLYARELIELYLLGVRGDGS